MSRTPKPAEFRFLPRYALGARDLLRVRAARVALLCLPMWASLLSPSAMAQPVANRASHSSMGVMVTVLDPCLNSANASRPQCAGRLQPRVRETIEPEFMRNDDGSVRDDVPPSLFYVRQVDYF